MFNKTYLVAGPRHVTHNTHVTEKRAPTDESVKLLREMEKAAVDQVEHSIRLEANGFSCLVQFFRNEYSSENVFLIHFELNGKKRKVEHRVSTFASKPKDKYELANELLDVVAKEIARECIPDLSKMFANNLVWL